MPEAATKSTLDVLIERYDREEEEAKEEAEKETRWAQMNVTPNDLVELTFLFLPKKQRSKGARNWRQSGVAVTV